jgi:hypothetical protein
MIATKDTVLEYCNAILYIVVLHFLGQSIVEIVLRTQYV